MKGHKQLILGLCVALVSCSVILVYSAEQGKMSREFREQFIKDFKRTSMDTAPGDAMFLRILVESGKCKRGVEVGSNKGFGAINMGIAFERTGGHLFTLEINPKLVKQCQSNLEAVGLE